MLWFSKREPQYQVDYEELEGSFQLFKMFPQMVNQEMIEQIKSGCDHYVESVSQRGLPQSLVSRFTGESVVNTNGQGIEKNQNDYYPSPEMHLDAASDLEVVCQKYAESIDHRKNSRSSSIKTMTSPFRS